MLRIYRPLFAKNILTCSVVLAFALPSLQAQASSTPNKRPVAQPAASATAQAPRQTRSVTTAPVHRAATGSMTSKRAVAAAPEPRAQRQLVQRSTQQLATATVGATALASGLVVSEGERQGLRLVPNPLNLNSSVALVMDADTNEILLGKNDTAVVPIASLTKLMTGILIADANLPMDEMLTITNADVDRLKNSGSRLTVGSSLTREQALHLAMMSSENRATHALARTFPGGVQEFVRLMNRKAGDLGMRDTHFADPTGLSSHNRSSARDVALLVAASYQRPVLREFSTSHSYELLVGNSLVPYRNSNRLVKNQAWDIGLQKTGFIREAGRCVTMQVNIAGRRLIMVLLDASDGNARLGDAERLRRWVESTQYTAQYRADYAANRS